MMELEWIYKVEAASLANGRDTKYDNDSRKKKLIECIDSQSEPQQSNLITPELFKKAVLDLHSIILTDDNVQRSIDILNNKTVSALNSEEIPF